MTTAPGQPGPLTWLHIGDLHLREPDGENRRDLERIVALIASLPPGCLDFVLLPGDNADDGTAAQYAMVRDALAPLHLPVHVLPGDHDMVPGSLAAFHSVLGAPTLPYAEVLRGRRCLFLDVVSAGTGGPDFRLGAAQLDWTEREVEEAAAAGQDVAVFMHTYPADLREGGERMGALLAHPRVTCVDMGHTHYNELANDGGTILMATRSTGQTEEGPPGFSVVALDGGCVGWRFKVLDGAWPFVLVTHPADVLLTTRRSRGADLAEVRARVLSDVPLRSVMLRADDGPALPMQPVPGQPGLFRAVLDGRADRIAVQARDASGRSDEDVVEPAPAGYAMPRTAADGSDKDAIGAWPGKGIVGGQLGPNRNGRKW